MRWTSVVGIILASVALRAVPGQAGSGDRTLLDAPRGTWLASLSAEAPVTVLEVRDGWRRVRLEGWLPPESASSPERPAQQQPQGAAAAAPVKEGPAAAPVKEGPAAAPPSPTTTAPSGARPESPAGTIRGVLAAPLGSAAGPGRNAVVLLLVGVEALEADHARTGADCRQRLDAADARAAQLQAESQRALNSTDNFREASQRSDAMKKEAQAAQAQRRTILEDCRRAADALFENHALQRTIADGSGGFEFKGLAPGLYRVVATAAGETAPRAWSFDCRVDGPQPVMLDPNANRSRVGPYWDLR